MHEEYGEFMDISIIVGMGKGREIGRDGRLLWHLREDLQHFKTLTMGHHVLMGRKTFQSIGRPLPGRHVIVLTRDAGFAAEGCQLAPDFGAAVEFALLRGETELFVAGGGEIYCQALSVARRIHLSLVDFTGPADTYFPAFEKDGSWELIRSIPREPGEAGLSWSYQVWERPGRCGDAGGP